MKKWTLAIAVTIIILFLFIYIFIPNTLNISTQISVHCTKNEFVSGIRDSIKFRKIVNSSKESTTHKYFYKLSQPYSNGADFIVEHEGKKILTHMLAMNIGTDSILITWEGKMAAGRNPIKRLKSYYEAIQLKRNMSDVGKKMSSFLNNTENIYGFPIVRTNFNNTILLAVRENRKVNPTTDDLYKLIDDLRSYIRNSGGKETDYPMFHVIKKDSINYDVMVAIPVDRILSEKNPYFIIRMAHMEGKFVKADVKGGPYSIKEAHWQIQRFMMDHQLTSPAIPFEIMVTDRSKIMDTAQWITKIYYPST